MAAAVALLAMIPALLVIGVILFGSLLRDLQ